MKQAIIITKCDALSGTCGEVIEGGEDVPSQVIVWNGMEFTFDVCREHGQALDIALKDLLNSNTRSDKPPKPKRASPTHRPAEECPYCKRSFVRLNQHITVVHSAERR